MAKSIRLLNVDKIVTSSGNEVDLTQLKAKSEWVIDGAAKSATQVLQIGGYIGGGQCSASIHRMTIADNSVSIGWSSHQRGQTSPSISSNGSQWMTWGDG